MIQLPTDIARMLDAAARRHAVAPALARAVAWVESNGKTDVVSRAGAVGVMQLMPRTAAALGVTDPTDAASNIDGGVRFLSRLVRDFGDVSTALAAYNWGPGNVRSGKRRPSSVAVYIGKVLRRMRAESGDGAQLDGRQAQRGGMGALLAVGVLGAIAFLVLLARGRRSSI